MSSLIEQIESNLPSSLQLPAEIKKLFQWIEDKGSIMEYEETLHGSIHPFGIDCDTCIDISFYAEKHTDDWWCFDVEDFQELNISERLSIFAQTGGDGSVAAFWLDDDNKQKIVHIGSGSGSDLMCILADNPIDFIRLVAIGYDEICWQEYFDEIPESRQGKINNPNIEFQKWVESEFNTTIPLTASEIVKNPAVMWDVNSNDSFCQWISKINENS